MYMHVCLSVSVYMHMWCAGHFAHSPPFALLVHTSKAVPRNVTG